MTPEFLEALAREVGVNPVRLSVHLQFDGEPSDGSPTREGSALQWYYSVELAYEKLRHGRWTRLTLSGNWHSLPEARADFLSALFVEREEVTRKGEKTRGLWGGS